MTTVDCSGRGWKRHYVEVDGYHKTINQLDPDIPRLKATKYAQFYSECCKLLTADNRIYDQETKVITDSKNGTIITIVSTNHATYILNDQYQLYRDDTLISGNTKFLGIIGCNGVIAIINDQLVIAKQLSPIKGNNPTGEILSYRGSILHTTDDYWYIGYVDDKTIGDSIATCIKLSVVKNTIDVVTYGTVTHGFRTIPSIAMLTSDGRLFRTLNYINFCEDDNLVIKMLHKIDPWETLYSINGRLYLCGTSGQLFNADIGLYSVNSYPKEMFIISEDE